MDKNLEKYYYFDLKLIFQNVESLIEQGRLSEADNFLYQVQDTYSRNIESIDINKPPFKHLSAYFIKSIFNFSASDNTEYDHFLKEIRTLKGKVSNIKNIQKSLNTGSLNYLELILTNDLSKKTQKIVENFFYREYKKAKNDHFDTDEFFHGCLNILDVFDQILQQQANDQKNDTYQMIDWSNDSCLKNDNLIVGPKVVDPENERIFSSFRDQLKNNSKSNYSIHLPSITSGKYPGELWETDITFIRSELEKARKKIDSEELQFLPKNKKEIKLSDLITHQNSDKIVESIKIQFKNIKGKRLKLLLLAFQDLELLPKERIAQKFYDCCKIEFDWNIASYNAMNGYNYNEITDSDEVTRMRLYIGTLTKTS